MFASSCYKCFAFCLMTILPALQLWPESRKDHVVSFFLCCVPLSTALKLLYASTSNSLLCVLLVSGLNLNPSHSGRMRLQKCFRFSWNVFLAYGNLLTIFLRSFTVIRGPFVPLKFLRALVVNLSFVLYH